MDQRCHERNARGDERDAADDKQQIAEHIVEDGGERQPCVRIGGDGVDVIDGGADDESEQDEHGDRAEREERQGPHASPREQEPEGREHDGRDDRADHDRHP